MANYSTIEFITYLSFQLCISQSVLLISEDELYDGLCISGNWFDLNYKHVRFSTVQNTFKYWNITSRQNSNDWLQTSFYNWRLFFREIVSQVFSLLRILRTVYGVWNLQTDRKCVALQCLLWVEESEDLWNINRFIYVYILWTGEYCKILNR